jgi:hypothetical protein
MTGLELTPTFGAALELFVDAIRFIFSQQPSVTGELQLGGPSEFLDLTATHLLLSGVAVLVATAIAVPIGSTSATSARVSS